MRAVNDPRAALLDQAEHALRVGSPVWRVASWLEGALGDGMVAFAAADPACFATGDVTDIWVEHGDPAGVVLRTPCIGSDVSHAGWYHRIVTALYRGIMHRDVCGEIARQHAASVWVERIVAMVGRLDLLGVGDDQGCVVAMAPVLAWRCRSVEIITHALTSVLVDTFGNVTVAITPWHGQWVALATDQHWILGGGIHGLGEGTVLGRHVWDCSNQIKITVGIGARQGSNPVVCGDEVRSRVAWAMGVLLDDPIDYVVQVIGADSQEMEPWRLGHMAVSANASQRLGVNSRLMVCQR